MHYKITIFGAYAPYPRLIYWIASSILQGKKDDMSSKSGSWLLQIRGMPRNLCTIPGFAFKIQLTCHSEKMRNLQGSDGTATVLIGRCGGWDVLNVIMKAGKTCRRAPLRCHVQEGSLIHTTVINCVLQALSGRKWTLSASNMYVAYLIHSILCTF